MDTRDIYWVYQLLLEHQSPARSLDRFPAYRQLLVEVRMAVGKCEDAVSYLKDWCEEEGLKIQFVNVEKGWRDSLPEHHPCKLIERFVDEVPLERSWVDID